MRPLSLYEEISWSRSAPVHLALLRESVPLQSAAAAALKFDAVSIRAVEAKDLPVVGPVGFACHGVDGVRRALFGRDDLVIPLGRCVGVGNVFIADVVGFAYGQLGGARVMSGPEWIRPIPPSLQHGRPQAALFQIDAIAPDPAHVTSDELMEMLRSMLADRFNLQVHREIREAPGWSLVAAKNGPRLKEASTGVYQESPYPTPSGSGQIFVKGKSRMDGLAEILGRIVDSPVIDKTGLTSVYDYEFQVVLLQEPAERGVLGERGVPQLRPALDVASELSGILQDRLGLVLQKEKAVPEEMIVIDHMEMPTSN